jgi:hypothetical protein
MGKNFTLKFFSFTAGNVDTANKHSFVNISANSQRNLESPSGILRGLGETDSWKKKLEAENLVPDSF